MVRIKEEERLFAYTIQSSDKGEICSVGIYENTSSRAFMPFFSNQGWFDKESARITVVGTVCKMAEAARREWFDRVLSPPNVAKIGELLHPSTPTDNSFFQDASLFQESIRAKLDACLLDHSFGDISLGVDGVRARKKAEIQAVTTENADDEPDASSRGPPKKRRGRGKFASSSAPPPNLAAPEEEEKTKTKKKVQNTPPPGHPPVRVGARVRIYWPSEADWFEACVLRVAFQDGDWIFRVRYDDDHHEEWRSASADVWELASSFPSSSSLAPPPSRAKVHAQSPLSAPLPPEQSIPAPGGASQCLPSAFCMMNGSGCPTFPAWARFCPSCGSKQF